MAKICFAETISFYYEYRITIEMVCNVVYDIRRYSNTTYLMAITPVIKWKKARKCSVT